MLQYTTAGEGLRFGSLAPPHGRQSSVGQLDMALDEAKAKGWTTVDMKADWKQVFSFGSK